MRGTTSHAETTDAASRGTGDAAPSSTKDEQRRNPFGARLKTLRKQSNGSQKELAATREIRFQWFNDYESRRNTPPAEMLFRLADRPSVNIEFLLTGGATQSAAMSNARLFRRLQIVKGLPADDQETVIEAIDALVATQRVSSALGPVDAAGNPRRFIR